MNQINEQFRFRIRRGARLCARPRSGGPPASLAGSRAERGWGGGTPNPHRRGLRPLWTLPPDRGVRRGAEPGGGSRAAPTRMERRGRGSAHTGGPLRGKIAAQTAILPQEVRPLPWREAERKGVGGGTPPPTPPPKRAAPSLDSPAGQRRSPGRRTGGRLTSRPYQNGTPW